MTALILTAIAALAVWLAGRRDPSRDPRLSTLAVGLLVLAPLFPLLPKLPLLPSAGPAAADSAGTPWLLLIWAAGAGLGLLRVAAGFLKVAAWRSRSTTVTRLDMQGSGCAELRILPGLRSPVAAGIIRPVIFVPDAWHLWPLATRDAVLAHELAHLSRRDPLRKLLASLACAIHWFNPLVHWIARRLEAQCEFAADATVLARGHAAANYAHLLCDLAEDCRAPLPALAMAHRSRLEQRVSHMLSDHPPHGRWVLGGLIAATVFTAIALAILGPAATTPAVSPAEVDLRLTADPFPGN
jgi:beta-lactamase regulating signal transducer with metallopeptidase domain